MWKLLLVPAAALMAESSALACVCIHDEDREVARQIASKAIAVAEVVRLSPTDSAKQLPDVYRVLQVHVGKAPETFWRGRQYMRWPNGGISFTLGTTCDGAPSPGEQRVVVLYAPEADHWQPEKCGAANGAAADGQTLAIGGTCDRLFLMKEGALEMIKEEARRIGR